MGGQPKTYPDKKQLHEYLGRNQRYIPFHKVFQILFFEKRRGFVCSFFGPKMHHRTFLNCFVLNALSSKEKPIENF